MKSVILNAADKIQDSGDGNLLGMSRTLLDESGRNWTEGDAYQDERIPLHAELGTGHLNAFRAYEQLAGGQWAPGSVPPVGWNYSDGAESDGTESDGAEDYIFEQPLAENSYVSATLSWERVVELNDSGDEYFDADEGFTGRPLSNFDLYLMPVDTDDVSQSVWSSVSAEDSLEHIFIPVPENGFYKLRVVQKSGDEVQPYAIAWWTKAETLAE